MPIMTMTNTAEEKIKELCTNNNKWAVRLGIKGGGCAGFSYDWGFAEPVSYTHLRAHET